MPPSSIETHGRTTWAPGRQIGISGWGADYPSASDFFSGFTCASYSPNPVANSNYAAFCDHRVDAEIERARTLQTEDPAAASRLWARIDREITDEAPWVTMHTSVISDFVSRRTGNYTHCFLSSVTFTTAACLDQLWVH